MQSETVAIFLAHLNPLTKTHVHIISLLANMYKMVYVFPVRFLVQGREINTRSFPFTYELRRTMIESIFGTHRVAVLPHYTFYAPFIKYLPPLISPYSWALRNNIVRTIKKKGLYRTQGTA
jgi:hypothetical protein